MCILLLCGSHHNHWHLNNFRKSTFHARILWSHHCFANQCQHTGAYIVVISWRLSNQMHVAHAISKATLIISLNTSYKDIFASQIWLNYIKCSEFALLAHTHTHAHLPTSIMPHQPAAAPNHCLYQLHVSECHFLRQCMAATCQFAAKNVSTTAGCCCCCQQHC